MAHDFSISDVLAWARTKPADEAYVYNDTENCALCQFLRDTGRAAKPTVYSDPAWQDKGGRKQPYPLVIDYAAIGEGAVKSGWTFGKFADRLEALAVSA